MTARIVCIAAGGLAIAGHAFFELANAGRWIEAGLYGLGVPLAAAIEWRAAWRRGPEESAAAERLIILIAVALSAT